MAGEGACVLVHRNFFARSSETWNQRNAADFARKMCGHNKARQSVSERRRETTGLR
jgi:hypothetical protein